MRNARHGGGGRSGNSTGWNERRCRIILVKKLPILDFSSDSVARHKEMKDWLAVMLFEDVWGKSKARKQIQAFKKHFPEIKRGTFKIMEVA